MIWWFTAAATTFQPDVALQQALTTETSVTARGRLWKSACTDPPCRCFLKVDTPRPLSFRGDWKPMRRTLDVPCVEPVRSGALYESRVHPDGSVDPPVFMPTTDLGWLLSRNETLWAISGVVGVVTALVWTLLRWFAGGRFLVEPRGAPTRGCRVLRPWPRGLAVLGLVSAAGPSLVLLWAIVAESYVLTLLLVPVVLAEGGLAAVRWRSRPHGAFAVAAVLVGLLVGSATCGVSYFWWVHERPEMAVMLLFWGALLLLPWVLARRLLGLLRAWASHFEFELGSDLRWRMASAGVTSSWHKIPRDGLRPVLERTRRGVFLDLGDGHRIRVQGTSGRVLAGTLQDLETHAVLADLPEDFAKVRGMVSDGTFSAPLTRSRRWVALLPVLGAVPGAVCVLALGATLLQTPTASRYGMPVLVLGAAWILLACMVQVFLDDPHPVRGVPRWYDRAS